MRSWLLVLVFTASFLHAESPQEALQEIVFATTFKELQRHLPVTVVEELAKANPAIVQSMERNFLAEQQRVRQYIALERGYGNDLVIMKQLREPHEEARISAERWISDGAHAFFRVQRCGKEPRCEPMGEVWLEYEDGAWRVTEARMYQGHIWFSQTELIEYLHRPPYSENEASAIGSLRTINTASVTYASTYGDGFAPSLESLACNEGEDPDAAHSCLIEPSLGAGEKSGYVFRYERSSQNEYKASARPKQFGVTGKRSFFTDESGVIRFTDEDRESTVDDEPLQ